VKKEEARKRIMLGNKDVIHRSNGEPNTKTARIFLSFTFLLFHFSLFSLILFIGLVGGK